MEVRVCVEPKRTTGNDEYAAKPHEVVRGLARGSIGPFSFSRESGFPQAFRFGTGQWRPPPRGPVSPSQAVLAVPRLQYRSLYA